VHAGQEVEAAIGLINALLDHVYGRRRPEGESTIAYALIRDTNNAISQSPESADAHEEQIFYLKYDPFFDEIRSDPRYVAPEKRAGLM
jgi:hypothetical protein